MLHYTHVLLSLKPFYDCFLLKWHFPSCQSHLVLQNLYYYNSNFDAFGYAMMVLEFDDRA